MDWKRILNKGETAGRGQTVWKPTEGELQVYLEALVAELNFRLLMEPKEETSATEAEEILMAMQPEQMLWVDGIALTSYEEREENPARRREKAGQHFKGLRNRTVRFFRRLFTRQQKDSGRPEQKQRPPKRQKGR